MGRGKNRKKKRQKIEAERPGRDLTMESLLHIQEEAYHKIFHWIDKAKGEVSGLGVVELVEGVPTVVDVMLVLQENTGSTTDLNEDAVPEAMFRHHRSGRAGDLNFWWHSHADMGVFWSGTDKDTMKALGSGGWFISTVFNKKREQLTAFYVTKPLEVFVDKVKTTVVYPIDAEKRAAWDQEYDRCCKDKSFTPITIYDRRHHAGESFTSQSQEELSKTGEHNKKDSVGLSNKDILETLKQNKRSIQSQLEHLETLEDIELHDQSENDFRDQMLERGFSDDDIDSALICMMDARTPYDVRQNLLGEGWSDSEVSEMMEAEKAAALDVSFRKAGGYGYAY